MLDFKDITNKLLRGIILSMLLCIFREAGAQTSAIDSVAMYHEATKLNSGKIPQEMIYLHLDNTSYYRGDKIHFACYLVESGRTRPSELSGTVYVELLNPNGKQIDHCVLNVTEGRAHGSLTADETPFTSGYYEIRAYTRYMLNFGPEAIFSRVIPVYVTPKKEGDWSERTITSQEAGKVTSERPKTAKKKSATMTFYPEGGHLVSDLPARIAYELTDASHDALTGVSGRVIDRSNDSIVASFRSGYLGRGTVEFTPKVGRHYSAEIRADGKRYWCDLPAVEEIGIALRVDNLAVADSVEVKVEASPDFADEFLGMSVTSRGEIRHRLIVDLSEDKTARFKIGKSILPSGVALLTLFNSRGDILADRMIFHDRHDTIEMTATFDRPEYHPFSPIEVEVTAVNKKNGRPLDRPFSIAVTEGDNHVAYGSNIRAELLLASEIKGYIHNPAYYFEEGRERELDELMMIQGWRRYRWGELAGLTPVNLRFTPETDIDIYGRVMEARRDRPRAGVAVSALMSRADTAGVLKAYTFTTDDDGRFTLRDSLDGKWTFIVSSSNKAKDHVSNNRIIISSNERPSARSIDVREQRAILDTIGIVAPARDSDSIAAAEMTAGARVLGEVEVRARNDIEWKMEQYMENSIANYDITDYADRLRDMGKDEGRYLLDILPLIDKNFYKVRDTMTYRGKEILFVSDPDLKENGNMFDELMDVQHVADLTGGDVDLTYTMPGLVPIDWIKNIYVNTDASTIADYAARMIQMTYFRTMYDIIMSSYGRFGCAVFIEYYPDYRTRMARGVRRATIEGYTKDVEEFYSPDYSDHVLDPTDVRRTLYWNPSVTLGEDGTAHIRFFNNSVTRRFKVSATAVASDGSLGGM